MLNGARRDGDLALAGNDVAASAVIHVGFNIDGGGRHGQDTTLRAKQAPDPVESFNRVVEELPESRDDQITERVSIEGTGRVQAQLHDVAPGESPFGFFTEGGQGHTQVARGQDRHFLAEATGTAAVVGDGDDSRQGAGDMSEGPQGGGQAVSATEGDDGLAGFSSLNPASSIKIGHYSLPMSRCMTRTECPCSRRRLAMASAQATERCFPPVHPMAIVTNGFNSAR